MQTGRPTAERVRTREMPLSLWDWRKQVGLSVATSVVFTARSTAFNIYAIRRGVLTIGERSKSLRHDLCQIPQLLLAFMLAGPSEIERCMNRAISPQ